MKKAKLKLVIEAVIKTKHFNLSEWFKNLYDNKCYPSVYDSTTVCNTAMCIAGTTQLHYAKTSREKRQDAIEFFDSFIEIPKQSVELTDLLTIQSKVYVGEYIKLEKVTQQEVLEVLVALYNVKADLVEVLDAYKGCEEKINLKDFINQQNYPKLNKPYNPLHKLKFNSAGNIIYD